MAEIKIAHHHFNRRWAERNDERVHVFANGHVFDKAERRKSLRTLIAMMRRERASTRIIKPQWGRDTIKVARDVVRNNETINGVNITINTIQTWFPSVLVEAGFFSSNSEVKRNRPDLWRDVIHGEVINFQFAKVRIKLA